MKQAFVCLAVVLAGFGGCIEMEGLSRIPPPLVPEPELPRYDPLSSSSPVRLYLAGPSNPGDVASRVEVSFVLWDSSTHSLVAQAMAEVAATGAGTPSPRAMAPERSTGLYVGQVSLDAEGQWLVQVDVTPAGSEKLTFAIPATISATDGALTFSSFEEALAAPGTDLVLVNAHDLAYRQVITADAVTGLAQVASLAYAASHSIPVGPLASTLEVAIDFEPGSSPNDQLVFAVVDPRGDEAAHVLLSAGSRTATLKVHAPAPGEWTLRVSGDTVGSAYEAAIGVNYTLAARLLDPPGSIAPGEAPVVLLVYDPVRNATVDAAAVRLTASAASGQASAALEEDPGISTYTGRLAFVDAQRWQLDASVGVDGREFRLESVVASS